ncbi:hypothetical protein [Georgenia halophila]|uniref:hypothetical protein n=1 Tax=Georgenia halophila TaxID=620889 RepID=UPI0031F0E71B
MNELDSAYDSEVVRWACPVPFFGRITEATVATVGINPSNREFVGPDGAELDGQCRRLPTLGSLALEDWSKADGGDIRALTHACLDYFDRNPYRHWFDVLERMLKVGGFSYYTGRRSAHLDLVAYATGTKWGALPPSLRSRLIARGRNTLAEIIRDSPVEVLVLNGRSVVNEFVVSSQVDLSATPVPGWTLPRAAGPGVGGVRYSGTLTSLGGIEFDRPVRVVGFNHNLQSSFGVTKSVVRQIAKEVGESVAQTHDGATR